MFGAGTGSSDVGRLGVLVTLARAGGYDPGRYRAVPESKRAAAATLTATRCRGRLHVGSLLTQLGTFAIASGLLAWLARSLMTQLLSKELEAHKAALSRELEAHKAGLERQEFEHRTRFSHVYDRRGRVLEELYMKLIKAAEAIRELSLRGSPGPEGDDPYFNAARDSGRELIQFYTDKKLYLDRELIEGMDQFTAVLHRAFVTFMLDRRPITESTPEHERQRRIRVWDEAFSAVQNDVPRLQEKIEALMRKQLGIDNGQSAN